MEWQLEQLPWLPGDKQLSVCLSDGGQDHAVLDVCEVSPTLIGAKVFKTLGHVVFLVELISKNNTKKIK